MSKRARAVALVCLLLAQPACSWVPDVDYPEGNPPRAAQPVELPARLREALPANASGAPVVFRTDGQGVGIEISHDATLDDPIARWGECMGRVADCYAANPGADIAGCVVSIERCASNAGGRACCPPRCLEEFRASYADHRDTTRAIRESIRRGTCVEGFIDPETIEP